MSYEVINVSRKKLDDMKDHYRSSLKTTVPQGAIFSAKTAVGCHVTAYQSGKVLFQGKEASKEAAQWQNELSAPKHSLATSTTQKSHVDNHSYYPPNNLETLTILGSDETGTGDYFGPMTVACVHLTAEQMKTIDSWGVRDSKTIKDVAIRDLAPKLLNECIYSLLILKNDKYNHMQKKGMNQGQMKALLHHRAIMNVMTTCKEKNLDFDGVLVDQFVTPSGYFKYLSDNGTSWSAKKPIYFATKAESKHPAVATASILARYAFLKEMDTLSKKFGVTIPKGAGPHVDLAAKEIIQQYGKETLYSITKWHFSNTQRALAL
ncbi:ribonuclease HIII [Salipaludibacillus agaradhaerens]|uniref:ribonuclease HIII n=1 Tax=Salipaludibacillus agaradhaerens TaxID=76935 RepID=UPI002150E6D5|nr:ribonuclease HIII [Salipaludibacillus agaradhaerens]MCR6107534.1 ribonuclease HIII [Salipaludibacillus agaradhaerens]MCR6119563.1 ribonuclease HIII [Salipaludibacillus agaradhaerens]UJW58581.1 ribonuclease HIII [Bacillus sp. A116_S68]